MTKKQTQTSITALIMGLGLFGATQALADTVAVTADQMIDVRTGMVMKNPTILIKDGVIIEVKTQGSSPIKADRTVNLKGITLVPGLIDMHTHIDSLAEVGGYNYLQYTDTFWTYAAASNAKKTLDAGFTVIRNVGSAQYNDVGLSQAIDAGLIQGPRVIPAANAFGATGGHCDETFFPPSFDRANPYNADNPAEGIKSVRTLKKNGARVIKICATSGVFSRWADPGAQQLSLVEMKAIVEEAKMNGLRVAAHAHGTSGIKDAIRAGVTSIEHASLIDDEGIQLAKQYGTYLSMDIYNTEYTQAEGAKNGVLPENIKKDADLGEIQRQNFKKAHLAGAKMVYGTDSGIYPHGENAKQFQYMVKYGMTPLQALQSATINAADALGMNKQVGEIKPGFYGDLVGIKNNPLENIRALEDVSFVMKNGEVIKNNP